MSWRYRAIDQHGREVNEVVDADSEQEARLLLRQSGLRVLELTEGRAHEQGDEGPLLGIVLPAYWMPAKRKDLVLVFRQLSLMLRAGHTLYEALATTAQIAHKRRTGALITQLAQYIQQGQSLTQSMRKVGKPFTPLMAELVSSGERSGELDLILERLASDIERAGDLKRQLITSMTYPGIVVLMAIGVVLFLVMSVVPRFATFLQGRGKSVPWAAQTLMDITSWLYSYGPYLGAGCVMAIAAFLIAQRLEKPRLFLDHLWLHLPPFGGSLVAAGMAQMCWTLSLLLQSGLTLLESLNVAALTLGNRAQRQSLINAGEAVLTGQTLAQALTRPGLPKLVSHMAAVGEKTGEVDMVMAALGEYYRRELDARIKLMTAMIEPVLIILVGGVVGFVYFAFFQAVMAVSSR